MDQLRIPPPDETGQIVSMRFQEFLQNYRVITEENEEITQQSYLDNYMMQIHQMINYNKSTVFADRELAEAIELEHYRFDPYLRYAVHNIVYSISQQYVYDVDKGQREFFVAVYNFSTIDRVRSIRTNKIGKLLCMSGTVTRTSEVRPELFYGHFICKKCGTVHSFIEQQYHYTEPSVCKNPQCANRSNFQLIIDKSSFIDWQRLRIQENADEIPAGSMPRSIDVICRNDIVEMAKAGDKVILTGMVVVIPDTSGLARMGESAIQSKSSRSNNDYNDGISGLKKLGVKEMTYKLLFIASSIQMMDQRTGQVQMHNILPYFQVPDAHAQAYENSDGAIDGMPNTSSNVSMPQFTEEEMLSIERMFMTSQLYNAMAESICPNVFGHMEVKRGILLMLLGGVHKVTKEGISLRGDINVCIVGDPSCAKSQFLKYVHGFLPRTIYTSGKSSSAAGLTASVVRDHDTGEFCVEAGALMLADNGICCIDEFDKMESADQVAIHEAMEQQTISITKAGIQATLNARTSILAAANPVFGRYDRSKTLKANITVSAAIMSRFDLFFVILDECNPKIDESIARHIVAVHKSHGLEDVQQSVPFKREELQRYISFARTINPQFTTSSRDVLVECYRLLRQNDILGKNKTAYRITVRQLESLVRLSEGLARLHLDHEVKDVYVREAYRLLQRSIIFVETQDIELDDNEEEMDALLAFAHSDSVMMNTEEDAADAEDEVNRMLAQHEEEQQQQTAMDTSTSEPPVVAAKSSDTIGDNADTNQLEKTSNEKGNSSSGGTGGKKKAKAHITAKEYEEITQFLLFHLKQLEEDYSVTSAGSSESENTGDFPGCPWKDLTAWYLHKFASNLIENSEGYEEKKKLINQVVRRIIKHEGQIMVMNGVATSNNEEIANDDKLLKLHPSCQI